MTSTSAPPRPAEFLVEVPDHWARFDLSDDALARARKAALKQTRTPVDRMRAEDLFRQARALNRAARKRGAVWGAGTATVYDDALFMGHIMVFAVHTPDGQAFEPTTLARTGDSSDVHPRSVLAVELPHVGSVVRVVGTERVAVTAHDHVDMLTHHTFIPIPGAERDFFMITCCSPNLPLAESVYELFDAIASTFRFLP
jgi:hypothetical protein